MLLRLHRQQSRCDHELRHDRRCLHFCQHCLFSKRCRHPLHKQFLHHLRPQFLQKRALQQDMLHTLVSQVTLTARPFQ
ncbi:hypothetical protein Pdw03_1522 [Penicillium digitatum]|uniref:Uncharacterized protein n=1 Tax=Penicillium digitatum TaxID=36651 RepID=A0A7T7BNU2_PENDI|nr:hypothetical protein Pdw03_1522 [Penicillium digitatum]